MIYLTHNYNMKEFETIEQAEDAMKKDLQQHGLSYELLTKVIFKTFTMYLYQYSTLYKEIYIIHQNIDMTREDYTLDLTKKWVDN